MTSQAIPDEALNTHMGVLGKTGAGKSYTARGLVERLLTLKRHVVIVDPTGAWWGLRTGFDIPIFGGRHGDVEISDATGEAVARIVAEQRTSAIVDLSLMSGGAQRRFMRDFAHRLRAKEPGALYLVIDEADEFLPQNPQPDMTHLFGDLKWMVRRGRLNGFRVMMITQRPAEIAKAVLTQIETLVAHRLTAPQDRKAIEEWVKGHHDAIEAREVLTTLASLDRGEAWVWCPDLNILQRSKMPPIRTFDSGRTPEPGETAVEPPALGDLDLSAIREALAATPQPKPAKGAALVDMDAAVKAHPEFAAMRADRDEFERRALAAEARIEAALSALGSATPIVVPSVPRPATVATAAPTPKPARERPAGDPSQGPTFNAIADLLDRINPAQVTWAQAAAMVGRKASGGNFNAARKSLRESGRLIEEGDLIRSASPAPAGMTRSDALALWRSVLSSPAPKMIDALSQGPLSKEGIGAAIGAKPSGGNFNSGLAQLRRNGIAVERNGLFHLAQPLPGEAQ